MYVAIKSPTGIPLKPYYNVTAQFNTVGTLETGAEVTIVGKFVGQVVDLRLVHGKPEVDLQMDPGTKLPVGTTARIRPRGLLGAEYVDLTPSKSTQMIKNGGVIPATQTSHAEQLTDVFAGLTAPARTHLQGMINGLGEGLLGRGTELNQTLATAPATLTNLGQAVTPLVQSDGIQTLISGADAVTGALNQVTRDFYPGLYFGAKALAPLEAEYGSVSRLLEQAPAEMTSIDASLHTTDTVLGHVSTFAEKTTKFAALAPQALHSLTAVLVDHKPLAAARTLLNKVEPAIAPTEAMTRTLNPELPYLSGLFDQLTPVLNTIAPAGCDLEGFTDNWRGFLGQAVAGQSGPLGPETNLSLVLAAPAVEVASAAATPTTYDPDPTGCAGTPGGSK
jgi:phospholipid/cholesterol/gamma-HCH transport system substrate-binding protein